MVENGFFDEKSEETASQHQEITSMLVYLEKARKEDFSKKYSELIGLLVDRHTSEEEYIFPRVLKYIKVEKW
jgi:hemerythrin superfamily protein